MKKPIFILFASLLFFTLFLLAFYIYTTKKRANILKQNNPVENSKTGSAEKPIEFPPTAPDSDTNLNVTEISITKELQLPKRVNIQSGDNINIVNLTGESATVTLDNNKKIQLQPNSTYISKYEKPGTYSVQIEYLGKVHNLTVTAE